MDREANGSSVVTMKKRKLRASLGVALAIVVALILIGTYISHQGEWIVKSIGDVDETTPLVDMAIDPFDRIHALYTIRDYGVRYRVIGGTFDYDVSVPGIIGLALDVDSLGNAYFAIIAATATPNEFYVGYYSYGASGVGENRVVDSGVAPFSPSIAVDDHGYVHITYSKQGNLTYATNLGSGWTKEILLSSGTFFDSYPYRNDFHTVVAVDSKDVIHVCYSIYGSEIGYVSNASGEWTNEHLYNGTAGWDSFDLVVDSEDNVHMCFNGIMNGTIGTGMIYGFYSGSGWNLETAAKTDGVIVDITTCSIEVDSANSPRIAYRCAVGIDGFRLNYLEKHDGVWDGFEVLSGGPQMGRCRLALNHEGVPYIAFPESGVFKYATDSLTSLDRVVISIPGILLACVIAVTGVLVIMRIK